MTRELSSEITLLETVGVRSGRAPLWPLHLERLRKSAGVLGVTLPEAIARPTGGGDHIVRYAVSGGKVYVAGRALEQTESLRLNTSRVVHIGYPHKTDDRNWLDDAKVIAVREGADDALLLDHNGIVVEATIWAVGWWAEDGLCFPALTLAGLPSVGRRRLGELTRVKQVKERRDAVQGRALIACNAARGVVRVSHLDGVALPRDSRTDELAARFWDRGDA